MGETNVKLSTWKDDQKCNMLQEIKFLVYSCVYEFDIEVAKGSNLPKKEKDVLDLSFLDPNNRIDGTEMKMKQNNDMVVAYITMTLEMNLSKKHVKNVSPLTGQM